MTKKRFTHRKWIDSNRELLDNGEPFAIVDTGIQSQIICDKLNELTEENKQLKKQLKTVNDNNYLNYNVFIEDDSVHISLEKEEPAYNMAFIDIYTNKREINSPFKNIDDAKTFGEIIVKILGDMND